MVDPQDLYSDIEEILGHAASGQDISSNDLELVAEMSSNDADVMAQQRMSKVRDTEC